MMLDVVLRCSGKSYIIALFRVLGLVLGISVIFCVVAWSPTLVEAEPAEASAPSIVGFGMAGSLLEKMAEKDHHD